ncbi:MAG: hypothetical protein AB7U95_30955 [Reyranella sp.]
MLVNFHLPGSVTRLELQGEYGDDVRITNFNNTDGGIDLVAINSDIADEFHTDGTIEDPPTGDHVGQLIAGTGTDLSTITSVGAPAPDDFNSFDKVRLVDGNVILQGSTNLHFGSDGQPNAYDENGGEIDAFLLSGNDEIWIDGGHQHVRDGDGNDLIGTHENDTDADRIELAAGANTVRFHEFNANADSGSYGAAVAVADLELHEIPSFNSGVAADVGDQLQVSLGSGGLPGGLEKTDGTAVVAGEFAFIRDFQVGELADLSLSAVNFIKFTTQAAAGNVADLFDLVIGDGNIDTAGGTDWVMASAYDATAQATVVFAIEAGTTIEHTDDVHGLATVGMSYTDYLAFESGNFQFVAYVLDIEKPSLLRGGASSRLQGLTPNWSSL